MNNTRLLRVALIGTCLLLFGFLAGGASSRETPPAESGLAAAADPWARVPAILQRIVPPTFPARRFPVTEFGAVGDGTTDCTEAFRRAVEACHVRGGGYVVVPPGRFLTGAIHLKSNVNLHVSRGSYLLFIQDPARYLPPVLTRYEGNDCYNYSPFIYAVDQRNVAISGEGIIDGRGKVPCWTDMDRNPADQKTLREMAEAGVPVSQRVFGAGHNLRPNLVQFNRCTGVLVEGVTLRDGPMWTLHPLLCTNVTIRNVTVESRVPNGDGIDPEACRDVQIVNCDFETRDDAIALKSGRNADGRRLNVPCENIVIQGCTIRGGRSTRNGLAVGSEMSGGVRNVFVEDCTITSRLRGISLKTNSLRGGFIEDIYFRNLRFERLREALLLIDLAFGHETGPYQPRVRRVELRNVSARGAAQIWDVSAPNPGALGRVSLVDCDFEKIETPPEPRYVARMSLIRSTSNGELLVTPTTPILSATPAPLIALAFAFAAYLTGAGAFRKRGWFSLPLLLALWLAVGVLLQLELSITGLPDRPIPMVENRRVALMWFLCGLPLAVLGALIQTRGGVAKAIAWVPSTLLAMFRGNNS